MIICIDFHIKQSRCICPNASEHASSLKIVILTEVGTSSKETFVSFINGNSSDVRNIKSYLLATLYNAPLMMYTYYQQQVNHDLYGGGILTHPANSTNYHLYNVEPKS